MSVFFLKNTKVIFGIPAGIFGDTFQDMVDERVKQVKKVVINITIYTHA